ncbi:zinc carboxypeptidase [Plutella xylostella]|uniref:zinc carboxypeptidase n=1 Tax=Plutella xylostella TaxID=51655 RepID=UPI00203248BB|nr:zinc carboxypeptidase [Plutella xylostella]
METNESLVGANEAVFVWGSGRVLHALVPEGQLGHVRATLRQRNLTATLLQHDPDTDFNIKVHTCGNHMNDDCTCISIDKANSRRTKEFGWSAYYDVDDIYAYLRNMSARYPTLAAPVVGGRSYEGRDILGLRVRKPGAGAANKPAIFIESGIHAVEWITSATITYFINELLTSNDPNITALRENFDWHIFPLVNPDGYHYSMNEDIMWRKTRSRSPNGCFGADPNRNWDYKWDLALNASSDPCDNRYTGPQPFSEVETRTLASYIAAVENLQAYLAFHSNAQMLLVPYSDSKEHLDNYDDLIQLGKATLEYGRKVNGAKYDGVGTAAEMLYPASGGSMDWVRHTLHTPLVYTWELRGWALPCWPAARIPAQGDEVTQMIHGLTVEARKLGYLK